MKHKETWLTGLVEAGEGTSFQWRGDVLNNTVAFETKPVSLLTDDSN